jgi:hypothetical protein
MEVIEGGGLPQENAWISKVQREALTFAIQGTNSFNQLVKKAAKHIPSNTGANRAYLLNIVVDALVGLMVSMGVAYCGDHLSFEEAVIANVRQKFKELRKAKILGKMNQPTTLQKDDEEPA